MARCELMGTRGRDVAGNPRLMIHDKVCGNAYVDSWGVAMRLAASMNGETEEDVECYGADGDVSTGTSLYRVYLDGEPVGWAEQGWLTPPRMAAFPPGP